MGVSVKGFDFSYKNIDCSCFLFSIFPDLTIDSSTYLTYVFLSASYETSTAVGTKNVLVNKTDKKALISWSLLGRQTSNINT